MESWCWARTGPLHQIFHNGNPFSPIRAGRRGWGPEGDEPKKLPQSMFWALGLPALKQNEVMESSQRPALESRWHQLVIPTEDKETVAALSSAL